MRCLVSSLFVPGGQTFCLSPGDKHFLHTAGRGGQTFFTYRGGGQTFLHRGGDKHFMLEAVSDDIDEKMIVNEANFLVSEVKIFQLLIMCLLLYQMLEHDYRKARTYFTPLALSS